MNENIGPSQASERIRSLDVIRGFALIGILLMNIEYFQRPLQAVMLGFDSAQTGLDYAVGLFVFAFVQGKFYTMFSLLFGMGFVIFLDRAMAKGASARWLFVRRLAVLAVFGAIHAFLIWSGDILLLYALVGFLLLFFAKTSVTRLWKWGLGFLLVPVFLMWLGAWGVEMGLQSQGADQMMAQFEESHVTLVEDVAKGEAIYREASYGDAVAWRIHEFAALYLGGGLVFFVPGVLGMFLIGAAFARSGMFSDPGAHRRHFKRMLVLGYAIGLPAALVFAAFGQEMDVTVPRYGTARLFTLQVVSNLALCLAYIATLVLLLERAAGRDSIVARMAPAGRMALTNYIAHSVVFTLLSYGYGLGLYGEYGRATATLAAVVLLVLQFWFSGWWLARFRMGPLEWLWRCLTYGSVQPMRSQPATA